MAWITELEGLVQWEENLAYMGWRLEYLAYIIDMGRIGRIFNQLISF
jgi:hypothetical protein